LATSNFSSVAIPDSPASAPVRFEERHLLGEVRVLELVADDRGFDARKRVPVAPLAEEPERPLIRTSRSVSSIAFSSRRVCARAADRRQSLHDGELQLGLAALQQRAHALRRAGV